MTFAINIMLNGELLGCNLNTSVISTWLQHHASHHNRSFICHVSAIQKDVHLSHCNIHGCRGGIRDVHLEWDQWCAIWSALKPLIINSTQLITFMRRVPEEIVLSGTYMCDYSTNRDSGLLRDVAYICGIVWEVLALCLAVWVGVQHSREMERPWSRWTVVDCFTVLIKTHVHYFIAWVHKLDASVTFRWTHIIALLSFLASTSALCLQHW